MAQFTCRLLTPPDEDALVQLLLRLQCTIARISRESIYRAMIRESYADRRIHILVCSSGSELAGYVIAIADWREFWMGFVLRHPLIGARILIARLRGQESRGRAQVDLPAAPRDDPTLGGWPVDDGRRWEDSSPQVAKVVHVGVDPRFRGSGIGSSLYYSLMKRLLGSDVNRLDAYIDLPNTASVRLHIATGWQVKRLADGYFASVDLSSRGHDRDGLATGTD